MKMVLGCIFAGVLCAQPVVSTAEASGPVKRYLNVSASLLSSQTAKAMFGGTLNAPYRVVTATVCNNNSNAATVPIAYIGQQLQTSQGYVLLPRDAALSVISAAQGSSRGSKAMRIGITAVELTAIAAGWSTLSPTIKAVLTSTALTGSSVVNVLSTNIPTHVYLTFDRAAFPDTLQLPSGGCQTGTVVVEIIGTLDPKFSGFSTVVPVMGEEKK